MTTALVPLSEAEIAELEGCWLPENYCCCECECAAAEIARTALPKLLSERREREVKLAEAERRIGVLNQRNEVLDINVGVLTEQLTTASVKLGQEHTRAEAAEATLARVRSMVEDLVWWHDTPPNEVRPRLRMALAATPTVVSSDRLTPGDRSYVEDARRRKRSDLGAAAAFNLIDIIDRLAPPVGHPTQEDN